jgi:hypothetical protein
VTRQLCLGMGGHHSARAQTVVWLTPPELLAALGPFDLDPCAPIDRPWDTAAQHYTERDDGLKQPWHGRVWLNPPYGLESRAWLDKMIRHGRGTALVFARTETEMFFRYLWHSASALLFLEGRLNFHLPDGTRAERNAGAPSVLAAYGLDDCDRLAESGIPGAFVPLACTGQMVAVLRHEPANDGKTWVELLEEVTRRQGGTVKLSVAYALVAKHPKAAANRNWRAKVRQTFQKKSFRRLRPGEFALAV